MSPFNKNFDSATVNEDVSFASTHKSQESNNFILDNYEAYGFKESSMMNGKGMIASNGNRE